MSILSLDIMRRRWPNGDKIIPGLIEGIVASSDVVFAKYGLTTPLLVAHFMAQASEESGEGLEVIENMNYSADRLRQVFPTHFTPSMAQHYAHNPRMIANIAYGGRMGNAPLPSDDGWNFRGAGLTQTTGREGRANLQKFLAAHGATYDIVANPALIVDPAHALECGVADWLVCGCLPHAMNDDIIGETKALNGGINGLSERRRQLGLWKAEFGIKPQLSLARMLPMPNQDQFLSFLTTAIGMLSVVAIQHNWGDAQLWATIAAIITGLAPFLYGYITRTTSAKIASVEALPGVKNIVVHQDATGGELAAALDVNRPKVNIVDPAMPDKSAAAALAQKGV